MDAFSFFGGLTPEIKDWVPTDVSGAALVFTNAVARKATLGKLVIVVGSVTYPVTADGTTALISLPSVPRDLANFRYGGVITATDEATLTQLSINQHAAQLRPGTNTGAGISNATLSGNIVRFIAIYEEE